MKRQAILVAALIVGFWGVSLPVEAGGRARWGFHFSGGYGGGNYGFHYRSGRGHRHERHHYRRRHRSSYRHHEHVRYPVYRRVYYDPVYETVCVGYDVYGRPIYEEVLVRRGHHERVIVHYSCRSCGVILH